MGFAEARLNMRPALFGGAGLRQGTVRSLRPSKGLVFRRTRSEFLDYDVPCFSAIDHQGKWEIGLRRYHISNRIELTLVAYLRRSYRSHAELNRICVSAHPDLSCSLLLHDRQISRE